MAFDRANAKPVTTEDLRSSYGPSIEARRERHPFGLVDKAVKAAEFLGQSGALSTDPVEDARLQAEAGIATRPSLIQEYQREQVPDPIGYLKEHPFRSIFTPLGAAFEAGEGAVANAALAAQRGRPGEAFRDMGATLRGERPAQIGDVMRAAAVQGEGKVAAAGRFLGSEPIAAATGLILTGPRRATQSAATGAGRVLSPFLSAGRAIQGVTQAPVNAIAGAARLGTAPARATGRYISKQAQNVTSDLPRRVALQAKESLKNYYKGAQDSFEVGLKKIRPASTIYGRNVQGGIPAGRLVQTIGKKLAERGLVNASGEVLGETVNRATAGEREALRVYQVLKEGADDLSTKITPSRYDQIRTEIVNLGRTARRAAPSDWNLLAAEDGLIDDLINFLEPFGPGLKALRKGHAKKMAFFRESDDVFRAFEPNNTKRAEVVMRNYRKETGQLRDLLDRTEKELKVSIVDPSKRVSDMAIIEQRLPFFGGAVVAGRGAGRLAARGTASLFRPKQVQATGIREALGATKEPSKGR